MRFSEKMFSEKMRFLHTAFNLNYLKLIVFFYVLITICNEIILIGYQIWTLLLFAALERQYKLAYRELLLLKNRIILTFLFYFSGSFYFVSTVAYSSIHYTRNKNKSSTYWLLLIRKCCSWNKNEYIVPIFLLSSQPPPGIFFLFFFSPDNFHESNFFKNENSRFRHEKFYCSFQKLWVRSINRKSAGFG